MNGTAEPQPERVAAEGTTGGKMSDDTKPSTAEIDASTAFALTSLIEVAPGAVVSRTIAKSKGGTITMFAFDTGEGLSEHSAPFDAFVQVVDGRLSLKIGGEPVVAEAGTIVRMPADVPHALHADAPTRMLLVMLREPR